MSQARVSSKGNTKNIKYQSASSGDFYEKNFKWILLAVISLIYLWWFSLFGVSIFIGDYLEEAVEAFDLTHLTDQHSLIVTIIMQLFYRTGFGALLYEILANVLLVFFIWHAIVILNVNGLGKKGCWVLAAIYCFYGMYPFIASFQSKDQLFSAAIFYLGIRVYEFVKNPRLDLSRCLVFFGLFVLIILLKSFFSFLIILFLVLALMAKKYWKQFLIIGFGGVITGVLLQMALVAILGATSIQGADALSVPINMAGGIFYDKYVNGDDSIQISDEEVNYYAELYNNDWFYGTTNGTGNTSGWTNGEQIEYTQWYTMYQGIISDHLKFPLWYSHDEYHQEHQGSDLSTVEYVTTTAGLCLKNFGPCFKAYFALMSGYFLPVEWSWPLTGNFRNPTYYQYNSDIGDNYIMTKRVTVNSKRLCQPSKFSEDSEYYLTDEDTASHGIAFYRACIIEEIGEDPGAGFADSVSPWIRDSIWGNSIWPEFSKGWTDFWINIRFSSDTNASLMQGWWVFWISVVLLIFTFIPSWRRKYRKLRPLMMVIFSIYIGLFLVSPVAYERYVIPVFLLVPFCVGAFIIEKNAKRSPVKKTSSK